MSDGKPQNPIYSVDAASVEACAAKVLCPSCGTLLAVRPRREDFRRRCPGCSTPLLYRLEGTKWLVSVSSEPPAEP